MLNLVSFLLKENAPVPWSLVREQVDGYHGGAEGKTLERKFERDKAALKEMGIPIAYTTAGAGGYFISRTDYFMPHLNLSPDELAVIHLAARLQAEQTGRHLGPVLRSALRKILFDADPETAFHRDRPEPYAANYTADDADRLAESLETISEAILFRKRILFSHRSGTTDQVTDREVEPYGLTRHKGYWFLVARCLFRDAMRTFRLDRIEPGIGVHAPGNPEADYEIPADFKVRNLVGRPAWERPPRQTPPSAPTPSITVTLQFPERLCWLIEQKVGFHAVADPVGEDRVEMTLSGVRNPEPLIRWLLQFGDEAEIIAPEAVRNQLIDTVRQMRRLYTPAPKSGPDVAPAIAPAHANEVDS